MEVSQAYCERGQTEVNDPTSIAYQVRRREIFHSYRDTSVGVFKCIRLQLASRPKSLMYPVVCSWTSFPSLFPPLPCRHLLSLDYEQCSVWFRVSIFCVYVSGRRKSAWTNILKSFPIPNFCSETEDGKNNNVIFGELMLLFRKVIFLWYPQRIEGHWLLQIVPQSKAHTDGVCFVAQFWSVSTFLLQNHRIT